MRRPCLNGTEILPQCDLLLKAQENVEKSLEHTFATVLYVFPLIRQMI